MGENGGLLRSGLRSAGCAVVVGAVGILGAGACAGSGGSGEGVAPASTSVAAPSSSAPAEVTATVTDTVTASPETRTPETRTETKKVPEKSPSPSTSAALGAEATVVAYFDAINDRDYRAAWELGGKNLAGDYQAFVDGFAGTERDTVRILGVQGNTVRAELEALQTDGSLKLFEGTYTVRSGVITSADVREVTGPEDGSIPPSDAPGGVYYENCAEAWAAGAAPMESDEPGYRGELDRDKDGTACEPDDS
ncbi:excalibur calcium-binding domain-containing protein [Streptomyces bacillaris]|uniref:excalibur calcium-binding domain-containing protein n=1 Tax=Streptomyces bacillaris TaxID=68179 RepID=UPI003346B6E5